MSKLTSIEDCKARAKELRVELAREGQVIGHSRALEMVAVTQGFRDWNTLVAGIGNGGPPVVIGQSVGGAYLRQRFVGTVLAATEITKGRFRITVRFDTPVNVSAFDSMEIFRRQVNATVDRDGVTAERTSDGRPHMVLDLSDV